MMQNSGSEDGEMGHKPRNISGLQKLKKKKNRFSSRASRKNALILDPADTLILAH